MDRKNDYYRIAEQYFLEVYPVVADAIIRRTGITSGRLLDLGCGGGHLGMAVMERGSFGTTFCDIEEAAVDRAKARLEKASNVDCIRADVHDLPFDDGRFDLVVSRGSMPFWEDQRRAFSEIYRVLKPGGAAYIGGGMGNAEIRRKIQESMKANGGKDRIFDRSKSKTLPNESYIKLFEEWGCQYQIIENNDEGHWFLFWKK